MCEAKKSTRPSSSQPKLRRLFSGWLCFPRGSPLIRPSQVVSLFRFHLSVQSDLFQPYQQCAPLHYVKPYLAPISVYT